jgi:hypothetical protein
MKMMGSKGCGAGVSCIKNRMEMRSKNKAKGEMELE